MIRSPLRQQILELASDRRGVTTQSVRGYTVKQVGRAVEDMVARGLLFAARDGTKFCRYFSSAARADAFQASIDPEIEMLAEWAKAAAVRNSPEFVADWKPGQQAIYPDNVKVTVCPPSRMGEFVTNTHKDW